MKQSKTSEWQTIYDGILAIMRSGEMQGNYQVGEINVTFDTEANARLFMNDHPQSHLVPRITMNGICYEVYLGYQRFRSEKPCRNCGKKTELHQLKRGYCPKCTK